MFHRAKGYRFGLASECKNCRRIRHHAWEQTPRGRAKIAWGNMRRRVRTLAAYHSIEIHVTKEEFYTWHQAAVAEWMRANPGGRPSVDRIDGSKHYEIRNLQILACAANSAKTRTNRQLAAPDGTAWCPDCARYQPLAIFGVFKNGVDRYCREHRNARSRLNRERHLDEYREKGW